MIIQKLALIPMILNAVIVNDNTCNFTLSYIDQQTQTQAVIDQDQKWDYFMKTTNNTARNDYLDIHTNNYCEQDTYNYAEQDYKIFKNLYIAAITPYYTIRNTDITLTERIRLNFEMQTEPPITVYAFTTSDNYVERYVNTTNWANNNYTDTTYFDIEQNVQSLNYIYNEEIIEATTYNIPFYEIDYENIDIDKDTTTYIVMYAYTNSIQATNILSQNVENYFLSVEHLEGTATLIDANRPIEVVDIPGLMFYIITLPFAFISQAFNLTLFPGTPYSINISNLFLGLIGLAMFLWVLKLILGKVDLSGLLADSQAKADTLRANARRNARENANHKAQMQNIQNRADERDQREAYRHQRATEYNQTHHNNRKKEG